MAQLANVTVYLVDDDEAVCDSISIMLETHGARVAVFSSASEILSHSFDETPDCLLIDVHLSDGHGVELLASLRATGLSVPAILMTGRESQALEKAAAHAACALLTKPLDGDDVADLIAKLVNQK